MPKGKGVNIDCNNNSTQKKICQEVLKKIVKKAKKKGKKSQKAIESVYFGNRFSGRNVVVTPQKNFPSEKSGQKGG